MLVMMTMALYTALASAEPLKKSMIYCSAKTRTMLLPIVPIVVIVLMKVLASLATSSSAIQAVKLHHKMNSRTKKKYSNQKVSAEVVFAPALITVQEIGSRRNGENNQKTRSFLTEESAWQINRTEYITSSNRDGNSSPCLNEAAFDVIRNPAMRQIVRIFCARSKWRHSLKRTKRDLHACTDSKNCSAMYLMIFFIPPCF